MGHGLSSQELFAERGAWRGTVMIEESDLEYPPSFLVSARRALGVTIESPSYKWWVLVASCSGLFATGLTITALTAALPFIAEDLHASRAEVSWVVLAPFMFRSVFVPAFAKVGDLAGRKLVWSVGFAFATFFSLLCGFAPSIGWLIAFRALAAVASAALLPTSMALIATAFAPAERVKALGWWSATVAISPLIGVSVGGLLVEALSWRWLFFAQFPFGVVSLAVGIIVLHESRGEAGESFDIAGAALSVLGLSMLMLVLNQGEVWGWTSPTILAAAATMVVAVVAFFLVEVRAESPVLPLHYFARARFLAATLTNFFANFAYLGGYFITSLMLADVFLYGPAKVSLGIAPRSGSLGLLAPAGGYLAARFGGRRMTITGMGMIVASMLLLARLSETSSYLEIFPGLVLSGFGLGLVGPPTAAAITNEADPGELAAASGALNLCAAVGSSMGIAVMQTLVTVGAKTPEHPGSHAYSTAFLVGGLVCVGGLVAAFFLDGADGNSRRRGLPG